MSKKMKRVASGSSPYGFTQQDARDVSKHQTLYQEYQELQKETEAMTNKLDIMKQRKSTLSAEVRFLRQRYKYLLETKSSKPPKGKELVQPQNLASNSKTTTKVKPQRRKVDATKVSDVKQKGKIPVSKESAHRHPSPVLDLNKKVRAFNGKETARGNTPPMFVERLYGEKEDSFKSPNSILDLNRQGTGYSRMDTFSQKPALDFDLNEVERAPIRRDNIVQSRAPVFDLNQTVGEDELEDYYEPMQHEGPNSEIPVRNKADEQQNDLKLSVCRNVGSGPSRTGKRKISWQDQMALQV